MVCIKLDQEKLQKSNQEVKEWKYNPELTNKLDYLSKDNNMDLTRELFYEIVLWKLNRFPMIENELLQKLEQFKSIQTLGNMTGEHKTVLQDLLGVKGIALPMASTILRFLNPSVFQIIDDRVFRVVYKIYKNDNTKYNQIGIAPIYRTTTKIDEIIEIYFDYLKDLKELCEKEKIDFSQSDRVLYIYDKLCGNTIGS